MRSSKLTAALIAATAAMQCFTGCSNKKNSDMPLYAKTPATTTAAYTVGGSELSGDNYNSEEYSDKLLEYVNSAVVDDKELELGTVDKTVISPEEGAQDYELGEYRLSSSGVKLYYDENEFPTEMVLMLEKYFTSFASADYNTYLKCIAPSYVAEMDTFLAKDYDYDLRTSFAKHCATIADGMCGDFKITRLKVEKSTSSEDGTDSVEEFFQYLNEDFDKDYYSEVKDNSDELFPVCFYLMCENGYGKETMLVQASDIFLAVKDGRYYTFG